FWITQRGFFQPKRAVHFNQTIALCSQRFNCVSVLDGLEMLPGECHHQQEQAAEREGELLHLAAAVWIFDLHQARIVDRLGKVNLWIYRTSRFPTVLTLIYSSRLHLWYIFTHDT